MLGGVAAAEPRKIRIHEFGDLRIARDDRLLGIDRHVQVAVREVPDHGERERRVVCGEARRELPEIGLERPERHRHVVPQPARPQPVDRPVLAHLPELGELALVLRRERILDLARLERGFERRRQRLIRPGLIRGGESDEQAEVRGRRGGEPRVAERARGHLEVTARHELAGDECRTVRALEPAQQRERRADRGHRDQRVGAGGERRDQREHHPAHDRERALGADQELAERVAAVVLAHLRELRQHPPVGQHRLEPEHALAHRAVAERLVAAGIGRDHAADGR